MKKNIFIAGLIGVVVLVGIVLLAKKGADTLPEETRDTQTNSSQTVDTLEVTTTKEGTGEGAKAGDSVTVWYTGMLTDGTVFDSNADPKFGHNETFTVTLGQNSVIPGWEQGLLGIKKGEKRHLVIPAGLAYGPQAIGMIPANSTLVFDVEAVSVDKAK